MPRGANTKEKIFLSAVDFFSEKNYKQCTLKEIAAAAGIRAASVYKHYENKEEILSEILAYYSENFTKHRTPLEEVLEAARTKPLDEILPMLFYTFGTDAEYGRMMKLTKIVMSLRFEYPDAKAVYVTEHLEKPTQYLHTVFLSLIRSGRLKDFDYATMSFHLIAFSNMLITMSMLGSTKAELDRQYADGIAMFSRGMMSLRREKGEGSQ